MLQKQLRLMAVENRELRVAKANLEKDKEILEDKLCTEQRANVGLMTVARTFRAQFCKARDSIHTPGQGPINYPPVSAPPIHKPQNGRGSLTDARSYTAAPPTEPRSLARPTVGSSSTIIDTQSHEMGHSFRIGHRSAARYLPIQNMACHELETEGPRRDTMRQSYTPSDE
ncbi:hypothetical protein P692DRAFT_20561925 [Suillus brevipes Sb2]|nr:hypothetical protein P692DRAFT_20561925 [Suillus brevipes Sb2]